MVGVKCKHHLYSRLMELKETVLSKSNESLCQGEYGVLRKQGRLCVPDVDCLRELLIKEVHGSWHSILLGATKMYCDLRETYWWNGMKRDISEFVVKCPNFQQVKMEHQRPGGLTQKIDIPIWKWEDNHMDFVEGFSRTRR